jgi:hypothetical protein
MRASKSTTIPQDGKAVMYDGNGGYEAYYDGRLICCGQWRSQVESQLDQFVTDLIADDLVTTADAAADYADAMQEAGVIRSTSVEPMTGQDDCYSYSFGRVHLTTVIGAEFDRPTLGIGLQGIEITVDALRDLRALLSSPQLAHLLDTCRGCGGLHATVQCPDIMAALFA